MDIKCRKTSCKHNNDYTCLAKGIDISKETNCKTFSPDDTKPAHDFSRNLFEADTENYANSRHIKEIKLDCHANECLFNHEGKCHANGITVLDSGLGATKCGTFIKG